MEKKRNNRALLEANTKSCLRRADRKVLEAGVAIRRAIAIVRGGIAAAEGICDRALTRLEASRAGNAASHRQRSNAVSKTVGQRLTAMSGITQVFGVFIIFICRQNCALNLYL